MACYMNLHISLPALNRLCALYRLLDQLAVEGKENVDVKESKVVFV